MVNTNLSSQSSLFRERLMATFSAEDLKTFFFEHFRSVHEEITTGMTKSHMIQLLLDYCVRRKCVPTLLALLEHERPGIVGDRQGVIDALMRPSQPNIQSSATAGHLRLALVSMGTGWSLLAENIGDRELTAISVTLRPPPSLFVSETLIEIPRLPVAGRSTGKVFTLQTASAQSVGERQRAVLPVAVSSTRLLAKKQSYVEGRIEQLLKSIDDLQQERDVASGRERMQLNQQISQQKETLEQYEHNLQEIAARMHAFAHISSETNQDSSHGTLAERQQPEVVVQLPFSAVYRIAGSRPARVGGVLTITFVS